MGIARAQIGLRLFPGLVFGGVLLACDAPGGGGGAGLPLDVEVADAARQDVGEVDVETSSETTSQTYVATQDRGGERCGSDGQDWVECAPRDGCVDADANLCQVVTGDYRAWLAGGGQRCGLNDIGTLHTYCMPRDRCVDQDAPRGTCQRQGGQTYPAYKSADGLYCGYDGWFWVYCEPGDACVSEDAMLCEGS